MERPHGPTRRRPLNSRMSLLNSPPSSPFLGRRNNSFGSSEPLSTPSIQPIASVDDFDNFSDEDQQGASPSSNQEHIVKHNKRVETEHVEKSSVLHSNDVQHIYFVPESSGQYFPNDSESESNLNIIIKKANIIKKRNPLWYIVVVVLVAVAVKMLLFGNSQPCTDFTSEDRIRQVSKEFPMQFEDTWYQLISGLESVVMDEPTKPSVFLFLHSNEDGRDTAYKIATKVAEFIPCLLGIAEKPIITINFSTMDFKNGGDMLTKYQELLNTGGVMIIKDLHKARAEVARMFHYFCDAENPLVRKTVFLFILSTTPNDTTDPLSMAEGILGSLWSPPLKDNVILPLITRLTTNVLGIVAE